MPPIIEAKGQIHESEKKMLIRLETETDIQTISDITIQAFKAIQISNKTEQHIVNALRRENALSISLVAEIEEKVVGHVAFSPVEISDGSTGWFGLGPVSVLPKFQRQGVGTALIEKGLSILKEMRGNGCVLVGDPDFYSRFGFKNCPQLVLEDVPQTFFLALPFGDDLPTGSVQFHKGFWATQ